MDARYASTFARGLAALALLGATACTVHKQETPDLAGPSEYGTSIGLAVTPDILTQDGASQSMVTVTALDANSQPVRNLSLRAEINVGGIYADFGSLSARSLLTNDQGRATFVYTAPPSPPVATDDGTVVTIVVTPIGTDYGNSSARAAQIRLVPPGSVAPPDGLKPAFTFVPAQPLDNQPVLFDASASTAAVGNGIASYSWSFGDGGHGSGVTASHAYDSAGTYVATLTITDVAGRSASKSQSVTVGAGAGPTAAFTSSPSDPLINQPVNFNASASTASPGRTIVNYTWDFGDGTFGSGKTAAHSYGLPRSYVVVLTVTDDSGKKATTTTTVTPKAP
jgi:chitodextrinase